MNGAHAGGDHGATIMSGNIHLLLNRCLQLDAEVAAEIYALAGNIIQIKLLNTAASFTFLIEHDGIQLLTGQVGEVNVRITGTPAALLAYVAAQRYGQRPPANELASHLEITGDIALAQQLTALVKKMEIDWEEQLAGYVGDTLAHKSAQLIRTGWSMVKGLGVKLESDLGEFLKYEKDMIADADELEEFNRAVDELRDDLARLKQRMARLEKPGN